MRPNVHLAALNAAARVAFSVALLNGCANNAEEAKGATHSALAEGEEPGTTGEASSDPSAPHSREAKAGDDENNIDDGQADAGSTTPPHHCVRVDGGWVWADTGAACTPWGPPVPPSIQPRARKAVP